jgi:hypothetical protein
MKSEIIGRVGTVKLHDDILMTINIHDRKLAGAEPSIALEQLFQPFLGKKVRVIIEECAE